MSGTETFRVSADAYDRHIGRYGAPLAAALFAFARVEPGMLALDVGCGPGALTAVLANRVGATELAWQTAKDNLRAQAVYERVGARRAEWLDYSLAVARAD